MSLSQPFALQPYSYSERVSYLHDADVRTESEDDVWHVQLAPDDVKVMTLEQLDDAIRLDLVDTGTPVWKSGMDGWKPLGVAVGLEDVSVSESAMLPPRAAPPPPKLHVVPAAPPRAPVTRSPAPVVPVRSYPPPARVASSWPPAVQDTLPPASSMQPVYPQPQPLAPVVPLYAYQEPERSWFGVHLLLFALAAGALLTLYRNDQFLELARHLDQESRYLALEQQVFGGPSKGTPRALQSLLIAPAALDADESEEPKAAPALTGTPVSTAATAEPIEEPATEPERPSNAAKVAAPPAIRKTRSASAARKDPPKAATPASTPPETNAQADAAEKPTEAATAAKEPVAVKPQSRPAPPPPAKKKAAVAKATPARKAAKPRAAAKPVKPSKKSRQSSSTKSSSGKFDLVAAMRDAVNNPKPKPKKPAGRNADYDPLNDNL